MKASTKHMLLKDSLEYYKEKLLSVNRGMLHLKNKVYISDDDESEKRRLYAELMKEGERLAALYERVQDRLSKYL